MSHLVQVFRIIFWLVTALHWRSLGALVRALASSVEFGSSRATVPALYGFVLLLHIALPCRVFQACLKYMSYTARLTPFAIWSFLRFSIMLPIYFPQPWELYG